jgi:hypothetical protein
MTIEIQRLLQEVASAQDAADVLAVCQRLNDLRETLAPRAHERLCEQIADLLQEQDFDPEADVWRGVTEAYCLIRARRRAGGPGWTPGERP